MVLREMRAVDLMIEIQRAVCIVVGRLQRRQSRERVRVGRQWEICCEVVCEGRDRGAVDPVAYRARGIGRSWGKDHA